MKRIFKLVKKVDAIDIGTFMIGIGIWQIHQPTALITVGVIILAIGLFYKK